MRSRDDEEEKPCKACTDFKSWMKKQNDKKSSDNNNTSPPKEIRKDCPLDKNELGRSTWNFLHTMAAYYPHKPTTEQSDNMVKFFNIFAQFYPCEPCALDFQEDIKKNPPKTSSKNDLMQWLCERHNTVNIKLDKPEYDCSKMRQRWLDGWQDGSCDYV